MPHANLGFETADGGNAGLAASWTFVASSSAEAHAGIAGADGIERGWESFEVDWDVDGYLLELSSSAGATYSASFFEFPPTHEAFEVGWATDQALRTEVAPAVAADYSDGAGNFSAFDAFELGWGVTAFWTSLPSSDALAADTFSTGWPSDGFTFLLAGSSSASYDGASAESVEDFEEVYVPRQFSAVPSTDVINLGSHGLNDGDIVHVYSSGRLPAGLNDRATYWVASATAHTFTLDALPPGDGPAIVDITDPGFGTHYLVRDRSLFWTQILED